MRCFFDALKTSRKSNSILSFATKLIGSRINRSKRIQYVGPVISFLFLYMLYTDVNLSAGLAVVVVVVVVVVDGDGDGGGSGCGWWW